MWVRTSRDRQTSKARQDSSNVEPDHHKEKTTQRRPDPAVPPRRQAEQPSPRGTLTNSAYSPVSNTNSQQAALIGPGVYFEGTLQNCDEVVIDGTVQASIVANRILVRESGRFSCAATVNDAAVLGNFEGTLTASTKLTVNATGRVSGAISCAALEISSGGILTGNINVIDDNSAAQMLDAVEITKDLAVPKLDRDAAE
ncbi:MAG: polymer-forming cytoskeletal protein [Alphaproteobacteria bacterium]|nr:polymer-forming cytoskeletal protein [Alphaproteobacteria bacterium]